MLKKYFFNQCFSYLFWCHFGLDFGTFSAPKIFNLGHFSVPKPRVRKSTPPFYKLYAFKCVPDLQNVPKRTPNCSKNAPQKSPRGLQKLEIWWFGAILQKSSKIAMHMCKIPMGTLQTTSNMQNTYGNIARAFFSRLIATRNPAHFDLSSVRFGTFFACFIATRYAAQFLFSSVCVFC